MGLKIEFFRNREDLCSFPEKISELHQLNGIDWIRSNHESDGSIDWMESSEFNCSLNKIDWTKFDWPEEDGERKSIGWNRSDERSYKRHLTLEDWGVHTSAIHRSLLKRFTDTKQYYWHKEYANNYDWIINWIASSIEWRHHRFDSIRWGALIGRQRRIRDGSTTEPIRELSIEFRI